MSPIPMSEAAWQSRIVDYAELLGLLVFHDNDSRRNVAGFPDLVIVGRFILFAELKKERGRISADQTVWLKRLNDATVAAGCDHVLVVLWRPSHWPEVQQILRSMR